MFVYFLDTGNELVINKRQSIEKMVGCLFVYVRVSLKVKARDYEKISVN